MRLKVPDIVPQSITVRGRVSDGIDNWYLTLYTHGALLCIACTLHNCYAFWYGQFAVSCCAFYASLDLVLSRSTKLKYSWYNAWESRSNWSCWVHDKSIHMLKYAVLTYIVQLCWSWWCRVQVHSCDCSLGIGGINTRIHNTSPGLHVK